MSKFNESLPGPAEYLGVELRDKARAVGAIIDVLTNSKLLKLILSSTGSDDSGDIDKKLTYHLALVCKGLKDVALDMLWESMDSYAPLLKLLPGLKTVDETTVFTGDLLVDSLFKTYARRVRRLKGKPPQTPQGRPTLNLELVQLAIRLARQLAGSPLLPSLTRLDLQLVTSGTHLFLPLIITSSLVDIRLYGRALSGENLSSSLFAILPVDAPLLRCLVLQHEDPKFALDQTIPAMLSELKHLEVLEINLPGTTIDPAFVRGIGENFPKLRQLKLDIHFHHDYERISSFGGPPITRCICRYGAEADLGSHHILPLIQSFHITLRVDSTYHPDNIMQICAAFPSNLLSRLTAVTFHVTARQFSFPRELLGAPALRSVTLTQSNNCRASFPLGELAPMSSIGSLEEFVLDMTGPVKDLSKPNGFRPAGLIESFVDGFFGGRDGRSKLKALILPAEALGTNMFSHSSPTLASLRHVATNAGSLERLCLHLDSGAGAVDPAVPMTTSPLRTLEISDSRPVNTPFGPMEYSDIAHYLDRLFPNLETVKPYRDARGVGGNHEESWRFIDHFRQKIKLLREQMNRYT